MRFSIVSGAGFPAMNGRQFLKGPWEYGFHVKKNRGTADCRKFTAAGRLQTWRGPQPHQGGH